MTLNSIPLHRLVHSRSNARRTGRKASLGELVSSIRSHGVRQNLNVRSITGGRYEVVAGGRRLLALKQLARSGSLPADHPVPCQLLAKGDNPVEISLAENAVREPMHPDDQCSAFAALVEAGSSIEEVASRFGVTAAVVRQRLKLAAVSPVLRALFRQGGLTLDQIMALALVDDHAAQDAAWAELPDWNRGPEAIRRALTRSAIPVTHRLARFVGHETYEVSGGTVIRDLFGGPEQCFLGDGHLLERLATDRLTHAADEVRQEGWSWVSIEPDPDWSVRYERVYPHQHGENASPSFLPDELARAGARLSVDPDGSLRIDRGLIRPEEVRATRRRSPTRPEDQIGGSLSAKLVEELTAHRTAALRIELAGRPDLGLAATVHALALGILYGRTYDVASCLNLTGGSTPLEPHVQDSQDGLAHHSLSDLHATWLARLPDDPAALWEWCLDQDQATLLDVLAFIAALSVNAVETRHERPGSPRLRNARQLSAALALKMTDWWRPSAEYFGQRVSKAVLAEALTEIARTDWLSGSGEPRSSKRLASPSRRSRMRAGFRHRSEPMPVRRSRPMMPTGGTKRDRGGRHLRPRILLLGSASRAALMAMVSQDGARRTEEAAAAEPGPTRRALLALLPASLLDGGDAVSDPAPPYRSAGSRSIERCWADLVAAITNQDRAIDRRDHLERLLLRLVVSPGPAEGTDGFAPDSVDATENGFVAIGEVLTPLIRSLADRHVAWERAAALTGLTQAEDAQALARSGVRQAANDLILTPTTDLTDLRLKLSALLAVHEPGPPCRHATPWRELRIILADVERLLPSP